MESFKPTLYSDYKLDSPARFGLMLLGLVRGN
jgi:hypothetical protein